MAKNNNAKDYEKMSLGALVVEKAMPKLEALVDATAKAKRDSGMRKIRKNLTDGFKIEWRCPACRTPIKIFEGKDGVQEIEKCLDELAKKSYVPCPKYGKKHLNYFSLEKNKIIFGVETDIKSEIRPIKDKGIDKELKKK